MNGLETLADAIWDRLVNNAYKLDLKGNSREAYAESGFGERESSGRVVDGTRAYGNASGEVRADSSTRLSPYGGGGLRTAGWPRIAGRLGTQSALLADAP